jgi:capsular exopolysaccharide synthesis family protein
LDPKRESAQQVANAYAEAYVASTLDKKFEANAYARTFLEDQVKQLKIRLEDSEKAMVDFAEREKMVEVTEKSSIAENNLAAANTAIGQLISERIKNEQLWRQAENATAINLPQFLSNSVIDVLRGQRKTLETEYQEKLENFKPSYPTMVQISNKMKEIDRQLAAEVKTIKNSLKAAYESSLSQENEMKIRIAQLRQEVLDLEKKGIQYNVLKREVETNRGLYNNLLQRYKEVEIAGGVGTNNVFIVDRANLPGAPTGAALSHALVLSLALGLGAGFGVAFLLEMLDDRVRSPEEMEQLSGLATLGIIPRMESFEGFDDALKDPRSPLSEAYRSFATALQFSTESGLPRSIAVTSAGPGEGKSSTVFAIARCFAEMGLKVLIVDGDLRKPTLHTKFRLDNSVGLSQFLTGTSLPPALIQKTDHPNLAFMASGLLPPNAADLLGGRRLLSLPSIGSEVFDLIIFDAPPLLGLADAQLLASAAAATIFVIGAGDQRRACIRSALHRLQLARVSLIGSVITKYDPTTVGYAYAYSERYAYGQGYGGGGYSYALPIRAETGRPETPVISQ